VAKSLSKNWNFGQFAFQMAIGNTDFRRISKPIVKNQWIWWKQFERGWKTLDWELTSNVTIKCDIKPKTFALGRELVDGWIGHALPLIWISMATRQMTWKKVRIKLEILCLEFTVWKLKKYIPCLNFHVKLSLLHLMLLIYQNWFHVKSWVTEKFLNFHTVEFETFFPH